MYIKRETSGQQAYQKLAALCARGEHCRHELSEKMRQWGVSEDEQALVMERLTNERFVDDARFARAFVRDKQRYNKWGRRKIEQALWAKHIDEDTAREALEQIDDAEYAATLRPMLAQKRRTTKAANNYELTMKLTKFALARGFTMDIIRQCLDVDNESEFLD